MSLAGMTGMVMFMDAVLPLVIMIVDVDVAGMSVFVGMFVNMLMDMGVAVFVAVNRFPVLVLMGMHMGVFMSV